MRSRSRAEREKSEWLDDMTLHNKRRDTRQYRTSCGEPGLLIKDKSKLALTKAIQNKEERGWECAAPIAYKDDFYFVKMVFQRRPLKEQV
ncbi:hypothetical protein [Shouchella patagoniensis]|uniref:hypothetical protein n=1 Tax=Shouchella patagoniensis TaxID=228576 RepID=UPI000994B0BD|nr:hypothetical protein [Shouchella patagoniensis]